MKVHLSTATMTAVILALASPALVGTNAIGAPSGAAPPASAAHGPQATPTPIKFTFKCAAYLRTPPEVMISNISVVPVPAGMLIIWLIPKMAINGTPASNNAISGRYLLKQPMAPQGGITLNAPPPANDGGGTGGTQPDPSSVGLALYGLRSCTASAVDPRTIAPMPMQGH